SGHVGGFNDPMVDDKETKQRFRADHLRGFYSAGPLGSDISELMGRDRAAYATMIPVATVVASSEFEAIEQLVASRKLQKEAGIASIAFRRPIDGTPRAFADVELSKD